MIRNKNGIHLSPQHDSFEQNYLLEDTEFANEARQLEQNSYLGKLRTSRVECDFCKKLFQKEDFRIEESNYHFCCGEHRQNWLRNAGEDHPAYKKGQGSYRGPSWNRQRKKAYNRDNGECQHCNMSEEKHVSIHNRSADVHHIVPYRLFEDHNNANDESNLITLCCTCHKKHERWAEYVALSQGFL